VTTTGPRDQEELDFIAGFGGYVPASDDTKSEGLSNALVSLDANVLLSFYRYSPAARASLEAVLRGLGDRLFVSHQAATEFWRNRARVIDDRDSAKKEMLDHVDKATKSLDNALTNWIKRTAATEETATAIRKAISDFGELTEQLVKEESGEAESIAYQVERDSVVQSLHALLPPGGIGAAPPDVERTTWVSEAQRRVDEGLPPGFRDAGKEGSGGADGASGDYLVWRQSLNEAARRGLPLVLVTGDEKDDWWWRHRGVSLGPRRELIEECVTEIGSVPVLLRPVDLMRLADVLDVHVDDTATADIERASRIEEKPIWHEAAVYELLRRLDAEEAPQSSVIQAAATQGGYITREDLFEVCGFAEERMLRGFTRPVSRITRGLVADGYFEAEPSEMLVPDYGTGVLAKGFYVPPEVTNILG